MILGELDVEKIVIPVSCDQCAKPATMLINDQPQCSEHGGEKLAYGESVLGDLVLQILELERVLSVA